MLLLTCVSCPASISCFFLFIWRSLTSTLFPYTTLFRSDFLLWLESASANDRAEAAGALARGYICCDFEADADELAAVEDRKSTRLNSSHLGISYAVFCLKKKKN